jgi:hypothetical protein
MELLAVIMKIYVILGVAPPPNLLDKMAVESFWIFEYISRASRITREQYVLISLINLLVFKNENY